MKNVPRLNAGLDRFVLLHHQMQASHEQGSHWDLMFQTEHLLLTFRLMSLPPGVPRKAMEVQAVERLPDHRTRYLDYEGPISGGRGSVRRIAGGSFSVLAAEGENLRIALTSPELCATLELSMCDVGETTELQVSEWNLR